MGNRIYKDLIQDMTWSYSRLNSFKDCPYRWFLHYLKEYEEEPQFYSSYGSFIHKLIENYYIKNTTNQDMKLKFLLDFKKEVKGKRPNDSIVKKYIQCGNEYLENFEEFPYDLIGVEQKIEFNINENNFIGYVDYLGEKNNDIYLIDNKSRNLKPRSNKKNPTLKDKELDEMLKQLYLYSAGIKKIYGKFPKYLCFNCFRENMFIKEQFDIEKYNETIKWALDTIDEIKNTENFRPNIDYFKCTYICGLNKECCYWQER